MGSPKRDSQEFTAIQVDWSDRWCVYYRLQELGIASLCPLNQSIRVRLDHPLALVQLWSVVKQFAWSRQEKIHWLESCWQFNCDQPIENKF